MRFRIGVYDQNYQLIGYKADSFWSLAKEFWKEHTLEDDQIPKHLIDNLNTILNDETGDSVLKALMDTSRQRFNNEIQNQPIVYLGIDTEHSKHIRITHQIQNGVLEKFSGFTI